jgi:hypothetical protein
MIQKSKRGGARPGAGRKPHPSGRGKLYRFYLAPALGKKVKAYVDKLREEYKNLDGHPNQ